MSTYELFIVFLGAIPPILLLILASQYRMEYLPNPLRVVAWVLILGYSIKSIYIALAIGNELPFRTSHFTSDKIPLGQFMVLLGTVFFIAGFLAAANTRFHSPIKIPLKLSYFGFLAYWPVFFISLIATIFLFYLKNFHIQILNLSFSSGQYYISENGIKSSLGFLLLGCDFIVVYFFYYQSKKNNIFNINIYFLSIIFVSLIYFLSSQRYGVILIVIGSILISRVNLLSFRSKAAVIGVFLIAVTLGVLSLSSYIRSERSNVPLSEISFAAGISTTLKHGFEGAYALDPAKLTGIVVNNQEFLLGKSFVMFLLAPVPRLLWQEKPAVRIGPYVASELLKYENQSGAPPSAIGEFYINFGWIGVAFGMFAIGAAVSVVRNHYRSIPSRDLHGATFALIMLILINFLIGDFSFAALSAIKYFVASFICISYYKVRRTLSA